MALRHDEDGAMPTENAPLNNTTTTPNFSSSSSAASTTTAAARHLSIILPIRARSVSPVGASRFEQPYHPPSKASSPTSPTAHEARIVSMQYFRPPPSVASTQLTDATTAASSSSSSPSVQSSHPPATPSHHTALTDLGSPHSCGFPPSDDPEDDEWCARFRSDPDIAISVSDECPDRATLAAVYDLPIFSADGKSRPFGSLYDPAYSLHTRQLVLFVRHFYCGACQAYLQAIAKSITREEYFSIRVPTSIIVIGCGKPDLIPHYRTFTSCPFPIFADPSRQLYKKLGMIVSLNIGRTRPEYMKDISAAAWLVGQGQTIRKSLKDPEGITKRQVFRGGNLMQIGGEFLFEDGEVVWCHRMRNYRNHAEVSVLRKLLELDE